MVGIIDLKKFHKELKLSKAQKKLIYRALLLLSAKQVKMAAVAKSTKIVPHERFEATATGLAYAIALFEGKEGEYNKELEPVMQKTYAILIKEEDELKAKGRGV